MSARALIAQCTVILITVRNKHTSDGFQWGKYTLLPYYIEVILDDRRVTKNEGT